MPSRLDAPLLYELLLSEMTLDTGNARTAARLMLDAANRTGEEQLYRRAAEMAMQQREGALELETVRAWRQAWPAGSTPVPLARSSRPWQPSPVIWPSHTMLQPVPGVSHPGRELPIS